LHRLSRIPVELLLKKKTDF